jgi:hypothetical protein
MRRAQGRRRKAHDIMVGQERFEATGREIVHDAAVAPRAALGGATGVRHPGYGPGGADWYPSAPGCEWHEAVGNHPIERSSGESARNAAVIPFDFTYGLQVAVLKDMTPNCNSADKCLLRLKKLVDRPCGFTYIRCQWEKVGRSG